jgi:hypothetical protein
MNYPTRESVELGLKLVKANLLDDGRPLLEIALEEAVKQTASFARVETFRTLCNAVHDSMCHGPMAVSCHHQIELLLAVMAKMFWAGWSAGRQEIIDAEVTRMGGSTSAQD